MSTLSDKSRYLKKGNKDLIRQLFRPYYHFKTSYFDLPSAVNSYDTICKLSVYLPQILLDDNLIQGDQTVCAPDDYNTIVWCRETF